MSERYSLVQTENEVGQIQEGFRRAAIEHPSAEEYENASRTETRLDKQAEQEAVERPERIKRLSTRMEMLFPGRELLSLRTEIQESFDVPQFGPYHNEGMFMDTHLELMLERVKEAGAGIFDESVPEEVRPLLRRVIHEDPDFFAKYIYLHDIRKKDCLTVTYLDGKKGSGTWKDWKESVPEEALRDPRALRAHGKTAGIRGISYFQDRGRDGGFVQHGADAERYLRAMKGLDIPRGMLVAIREHEVAYQFNSVHTDTYRKHFERLSLRERELAIAATFIDSSSSLDKNGGVEVQLRGFTALLDSKFNYELLSDIHAILSSRPDINQVLLEQELSRLERVKKRIDEPKADLVRKLEVECRIR